MPPSTTTQDALSPSMSLVLRPCDTIDSWERVVESVLAQVDMQTDKHTVFGRMVRVLETQYERRVDGTRKQVQQVQGTLAGLDRHQRQLLQERTAIDHSLQEHEQRLPLAQQVAVVRQRKRAQRRRRYDRMHWMPIVAGRCRRTYVHAMNKHAAAEHELASIRIAIDHARRTRHRIAQALAGLHSQCTDARQQAAVLEQRLSALDSTLAALVERRRFWRTFELNQARLVREAARMLSNNAEDDEDEWARKTFQMACFEYAECLRHGKEHFANPPGQHIEFECARCLQHVQQQTWPMWIGRHDLVCQHCYHAPAKKGKRRNSPVPPTAKPSSKQITAHVPWKQRLIRLFWHRLARAIRKRV